MTGGNCPNTENGNFIAAFRDKKGEQWQKMKKQWRKLEESANYKDKRFQNLSLTPTMAEGVSMAKILREQFSPLPTVRPAQPVPSVRTDLKSLYSEQPVIVWFGHSSYLIHCKGVNILVDPVFSGHASPISTMVKAFQGADVYKPEDMPAIDYMIITHNHYDHLDKKTIGALRPVTKAYYTSLGVGKDIADCTGDNGNITEMDWWETETLAEGITLTATPGRHFSGRGLKRGGSLWSSFVLQIFGYKLFIGGDSGYDKHFQEIGAKYGPFDIVILECGQYNEAWPYIHMMPEQTAQAAVELQAKLLLPVHWAKFKLALHPWNEPIERVTAAAAALHMPVTTPMIGEPVQVGADYPQRQWWR
ncbi:L-ascorbate metabolism protein UlaG, beta-lactamase superfamily [Filimonas lacunae]|uniref:L-ascorbate metabolism protein UlaG, beta-lactamase superfamily n=1 Tax=Filimonas lacunae TaxID=477680 RepID=A0A173MKY3_9BACT|nr:MBL fold metallo-hydrolase [Filimonas lacunae]BAV08305.1 outer membrane protein RomA [Filimonas lacunae]SIT33309.1 L-ascorbate metabolism protein UlaG, beta-lactamase superfamily [Filimonas lacunae]